MKVKHVKPQRDLSLASKPGDKYCYRTVVENTNNVRIKVIWFDYYCRYDGMWSAINITGGVMREEQFLKWYFGEDDSVFQEGWLLPGKKAICDPNWNYGCSESFGESKWAFIAVDEKGNTYFDEAIVDIESVVFSPENT